MTYLSNGFSHTQQEPLYVYYTWKTEQEESQEKILLSQF